MGFHHILIAVKYAKILSLLFSVKAMHKPKNTKWSNYFMREIMRVS